MQGRGFEKIVTTPFRTGEILGADDFCARLKLSVQGNGRFMSLFKDVAKKPAFRIAGTLFHDSGKTKAGHPLNFRSMKLVLFQPIYLFVYSGKPLKSNRLSLDRVRKPSSTCSGSPF
jgi:hypothetical protein